MQPFFSYYIGVASWRSPPHSYARLSNGKRAKVADIGCGAGWSSIGVAQAYPNAQVDGFDLDEPFIELARANAAEAGLNGRLTFQARR